MKTILRNFISVLRRFRMATLLNILGLSIAFAAFMVIMMQVSYDYTFDSCQPEADAIYREEIANAGLDRSIGQYFAALTNMRSVGVMGDERTYDYAVALRAVNTVDFMTADSAEIPYDVLQKVMSRIINEVKGVNRVFYDLTSKPPGTIEFE